MASNDPTQAIHSYVTDMLALEKHISKAFQAQIEDLEDYPTVVTELRTLNATTESHIRALEQLAAAHPIRRIANPEEVAAAVAYGTDRYSPARRV